MINNPPDPQSLSEGLGGGLQALLGGHGQSLQSLLTGAHSNPQILEQLLTSGALSPGVFEGIRYGGGGGRGWPVYSGYSGLARRGMTFVTFVLCTASRPVGVGEAPPAVPVLVERVGVRGRGVGLATRHQPDPSSSSSSLSLGELLVSMGDTDAICSVDTLQSSSVAVE